MVDHLDFEKIVQEYRGAFVSWISIDIIQQKKHTYNSITPFDSSMTSKSNSIQVHSLSRTDLLPRLKR